MARLKKNSTAKNLDAELGALRSDINALKKDTKSLVSGAEDIAYDRARAAIEAAEDVAERAYKLAEETATDWADGMESWTNGNLKSARETVQRQPISSIFYSLGAGILLGAILGRR